MRGSTGCEVVDQAVYVTVFLAAVMIADINVGAFALDSNLVVVPAPPEPFRRSESDEFMCCTAWTPCDFVASVRIA